MAGNLTQINVPLVVAKNIFVDIIQLKDKDEFFKLVDSNRGHLHREIPWVNECQTVDDAQMYIQYPSEDLEQSQTLRFGIFFSEKLVGTILVTAFWKDKSFELGYWIDASFQGKGMVGRSCAALLKEIPKKFEAKNAIIRCSVNNVKSQAVAKRLGFIQKHSIKGDKDLPSKWASILTYYKELP